MKALVTGGTGFLGGRLAQLLAERGWDITATGRDLKKGASLQKKGIRFIPADLRDIDAVRSLCRGQETVFHCGALSSPWGSYKQFYEHNYTGTEHVVDACIRREVRRLVHVSTPNIYFNYRDRFNIHEDDPLPTKPANPYAATKLIAEKAVRAGMREGLGAIIVRPRGIFGPGDTTILPRLIQANEQGGIPLIRGGQALLDMTYVDNVAEGLLQAALASNSALGMAYNLTNGEPVRLIDAIQQLFELLEKPLRIRPIPYPAASLLGGCLELSSHITGKEPRLTRSTVGLLSFSQTLDIRRAKELLGYQPSVPMEEGLRRFSLWWREEGNT
jgi:nucleoside-diphosphate-sugar epimerase